MNCFFSPLFLWSPIPHPPGVYLFTTQGGGDIDATWFCWLFFVGVLLFLVCLGNHPKGKKTILGPSDCVRFLIFQKEEMNEATVLSKKAV